MPSRTTQGCGLGVLFQQPARSLGPRSVRSDRDPTHSADAAVRITRRSRPELRGHNCSRRDAFDVVHARELRADSTDLSQRWISIHVCRTGFRIWYGGTPGRRATAVWNGQEQCATILFLRRH